MFCWLGRPELVSQILIEGKQCGRWKCVQAAGTAVGK